MALLLGVVLSWSGAVPLFARSKKPKLANPEAREALKRNRALQKARHKSAKARSKEVKSLRAAR
jgi:hypothetical protein